MRFVGFAPTKEWCGKTIAVRELAAKEQDAAELTKVVEEINRLLEQRQRRVCGKSPEST